MTDATFRLDNDFVEKYRHIPAPFGFNGVGEFTYRRTYSRMKPDGTNEEWFETIRRVVEGCYRMQERHIKSQDLGWSNGRAQASAQEMYDRMFQMKFLPPGRGLWAMGSSLTEGDKPVHAALNNCFAYDTEIITRDGIKRIGDVVDTEQELLTSNGAWVSAPIRSFGRQPLVRLHLMRQGIKKTILTTAGHRWFAKSQSEVNHSKGYSEYVTTDLKPGYRLQYMFGQGVQGNVRPSAFGIAHGITFGDGTTAPNGHLYLCGSKNRELAQWFPNSPITHDTEKDALRVADLPRYFKQVPSLRESKSYLYGWLAGYFAADGKVTNGQVTLTSYNRTNLEFVRDLCAIIGLGCYSITGEAKVSNLTGQPCMAFNLTLMRDKLTEDFFLIAAHRDSWNEHREAVQRHWNVESVEVLQNVEEVFCAVVPETHCFTLADNILTGNCGFTSTKNLDKDPLSPFAFLMDMSMLGVGVGFDVRGEGKLVIQEPGTGPWPDFGAMVKRIYPDQKHTERTIDYLGNPVVFRYMPEHIPNEGKFVYTIPDTREGWVMSTLYVLNGFFRGTPIPVMDYAQIRPKGLLIKGFGGLSSGPQPLRELHAQLLRLLARDIGKLISDENIVDIFNLEGCCVVAGNVRRSAEIAFGSYKSSTFLKLKDYRWEKDRYVGPRADRSPWGWCSNNSIFADVGMDYTQAGDQTGQNGEPGYAWLENMRAYGRMCDPINWIDKDADGGNPCLEQTLYDKELCNLAELFPFRASSKEDFLRTIKFAYLYAKTVTLGRTHWRDTNKILLKNRRIGLSMSGIQQFILANGLDKLKDWCIDGYETVCKYDKIYSDWFCVPLSNKKTSIKPSGTISLVAGATPGMHWPQSLHYIRRVCVAVGSPLLDPLIAAGYPVEPSVSDLSTMIVSFPVKLDEGLRPVYKVSMWEQLSMASFLQKYWSDNQVSCTVTFDPETEGHQIKHALNYFQYQLKGVSFLPHLEEGAFAQMPYEEITEDLYNEMMAVISRLDLSGVSEEVIAPDRFCDGDKCTLPGR